MGAGHDVQNAARIAHKALNTANAGKMYEGTYFQVWRKESTEVEHAGK
jgi:hypothetical protein